MKTVILAFLLVIAINAQAQKGNTEVMLETTAGNIKLRLYDDTPLHRDNFVKLVGMHVYDSLLFHRVIKDFMIQCGDPKSKNAAPGTYLGEGDLDGTVEQELRLPQIFHRRGVLAAAREPDEANPYRESSRCHFYLAWGKKFTDEELDKMQLRLDTLYGYRVKLTPEMRTAYKTVGGIPHLDGGYTVFGEIVEGLDVLEKIQATPTDKNNRPLEDQRILKAYAIKKLKIKN
ncbi:MAG: peptidylprolyl isomerase [Prevotella sp.]|nr:peptidylprolyl isomerase [Prevotella sp.]